MHVVSMWMPKTNPVAHGEVTDGCASDLNRRREEAARCAAPPNGSGDDGALASASILALLV